jgi:small subunit ribosomal protein S8
MVTDTIADFIVQLKNAQKVGHANISVPYSKFKHEIGNALVKEGFIKGVTKKGKKIKKTLEVELLYSDGSPKVQDVKRISKPGRRVYKNSQDLISKEVTFIISTPNGVMSGNKAAKENVGGEVLFSIR